MVVASTSLNDVGHLQVLPSTCRAMVGQVAGGGRTEKPLLKAGNAYHKFRVKRNSWPKVHRTKISCIAHVWWSLLVGSSTPCCLAAPWICTSMLSC